MLKFSWFKKSALLIASCIIIFAIGAGFVYSGRYARYIEHPARYKTNRNSVSDKNPENSLPASINNLSSGIEASDKQIEAPEQPSDSAVGPPERSAVAQSNGNGSGNNKNSGAVNQEENAPANQISATLFVEDKKYEISVPENSSVYDLMEKLQQETDFRFSGKNYSGLGFFVEEINGVKNNPTGENWLYYINGRPAQVGISNYIIKANDIIEWKYEAKSF